MIEAILIGLVVSLIIKLLFGSAATGLGLVIGFLVGASCYFAIFEDRSYRKALEKFYK